MRLFALLLLLWPSVACGSLADTVGWTGCCTCVVVTADGYALTAEHCPDDGPLTVEINGRTVEARKVYEPEKNGQDDVALLKLSGGPFSFAPIARSAARQGDQVMSWGFPAGVLKQMGGTVTRLDRRGDIMCNFPTKGGHSGGPLFNSAGEVVGILSAGDSVSLTIWIGMPSIQRAMQHAQVSGQPIGAVGGGERVVWVLTSYGCPPCIALKRDYDRQAFPGLKMQFVYFGTPEGTALQSRIRQATGVNPQSAPTIWPEGANTCQTRYTSLEGLRAWFGSVLQLAPDFWEAVTGPPPGPQPGPFPTSPPGGGFGEPPPSEDWEPVPPVGGVLQPIADSEPEPDFTGARLLLFAPKKLSVDAAAKASLALAKAASTQVAEATDGKAQAVIVSERLTPTRYAATCEAAGVQIGEFHALVMVPAQSHGVRAAIRARLMDVIRERLPDAVRNAPVGLLSETLADKVYAATVAALATPEPQPEPVPEDDHEHQSQPAAQDPVEGGDPVPDSPITLALAALLGAIRRLFGGKP